MFKGRSASMQRGAAIRSDQKLSKESYHAQTRISMSKADFGHFEYGANSRETLLEMLRPHIKIMARNGFRKPRDVARLLNKQGIKTAAGASWAPRLAWFLLSFLFAEETKTTEVSGKTLPANRKHAGPGQVARSAVGPCVQEKVAGLPRIETRDELIRTMSQRFKVTSKR